MVSSTAVALPWPEAHSGAYLGVQITAVTAQRASALKLPETAGAIITYVDQDGPACHAGLMENDVVIAYEGSKIDSPEQLQGLIHTTAPQKTVTLTIMRNGQRKDMKVTLGSWNVMSQGKAFSAGTLATPPPPRVFAPDVEIASFTVISQRHGLVVESLSPQLADFFGVPRGHGVLVRSVEGGSPAASAGIKAGDVILKVNNEEVHDMADWQRGMRARGGKIPLALWRDKREQNVMLMVPVPDTSRLVPGDSLAIDGQAFDQMAAQLSPELEHDRNLVMAQLGSSQEEMEQMRSQMQHSLELRQQDIDKMSRELAQSARPSQEEMNKLRDEIQKSLPAREQFDQMQREIQKSMPSPEELDKLRSQIQSSMKDWTPQFEQQMNEFRKQMEQQKRDLQKMMQDFNRNDDRI